MDPDEALRQLRDAMSVARDAAAGDSNDEEIEAWQYVGELFDGLDQWLRSGGFLPAEWTSAEERENPGFNDLVLRTVSEWTDREFELALGFRRT